MDIDNEYEDDYNDVKERHTKYKSISHKFNPYCKEGLEQICYYCGRHKANDIHIDNRIK